MTTTAHAVQEKKILLTELSSHQPFALALQAREMSVFISRRERGERREASDRSFSCSVVSAGFA